VRQPLFLLLTSEFCDAPFLQALCLRLPSRLPTAHVNMIALTHALPLHSKISITPFSAVLGSLTTKILDTGRLGTPRTRYNHTTALYHHLVFAIFAFAAASIATKPPKIVIVLFTDVGLVSEDPSITRPLQHISSTERLWYDRQAASTMSSGRMTLCDK
jgi:hypothetical protein